MWLLWPLLLSKRNLYTFLGGKTTTKQFSDFVRQFWTAKALPGGGALGALVVKTTRIFNWSHPLLEFKKKKSSFY